MRAKVGLWIDHRKALIVAVTDKGGRIKSNPILDQNAAIRFTNKNCF